jgi:hypothetical protein
LPLHQIIERDAVDVFHDDVGRLDTFGRRLDEADGVWVAKPAHQVGFLLKTLPCFGFAEEVLMNGLDDDLAAGAFATRQKDLAHATFAQESDEFVVVERRDFWQRGCSGHAQTFV